MSERSLVEKAMKEAPLKPLGNIKGIQDRGAWLLREIPKRLKVLKSRKTPGMDIATEVKSLEDILKVLKKNMLILIP